MPKRHHTARDERRAAEARTDASSTGGDTEEARERRRAAYRVARERDTLAREIEESRQLLDKGLSSAAEARLASVVEAASVAATVEARTLAGQARVVLSEALEWQGRYGEALAAVRMYEAAEERAGLDAETSLQLRVRLGLAYNYTGDYPKAIALLKATLGEARARGNDAQSGAASVALARVYRSIHEYPISRDFLVSASEFYRRVEDWRGLCEVSQGFGLVDIHEGRYESALVNYEHALKLVGRRDAPQILGRIYANLGGLCVFIKRPHDGIRYFEKAVNFYERTEHKINAATGYNNLGVNLMLVGEWERAHEALKRALALVFETERHNAHAPIILVSLGELRTLTGALEEAQTLLARAVKLATEHGNKWYAGQARRALGRCLLAGGEMERAGVEGAEALALAERIGDRQAVCESQLLLAEVALGAGDADDCAGRLRKVSEMLTESVTDLAIAGAAERVYGLLSSARGDEERAVQHFGRSLSIFEMLGDRYRSALAHYELGAACVAAQQPARATEHLAHAARIFRELGARRDLARAVQALDSLGGEATASLQNSASDARRGAPATHALASLLTLRLAEASAVRELLLRELCAVVHRETGARRVLVAERETTKGGALKIVAARGFVAEGEKERLLHTLARESRAAAADDDDARGARPEDAAVIRLEAGEATPALLAVIPREATARAGALALEPLVRVASMGLELCDLRERARAASSLSHCDARAAESLWPGFIHSSPAMRGLFEEIDKIRSSDATVLVTGESGTGKELVARAIHQLSRRRDKSFVAFNCTAVPPELSESALFGYRPGAFAGAEADAPGVIRAASGGTLFLDEIGDLPLDVQPKLLRFLREGLMQPLGDARAVAVDVRVVAATNCDLEQMVAEGRFREDLFYRLSVIRLSVPPLRERRSEIQSLVRYYIEHYSQKLQRRDIRMSPQAIDLLTLADWPGNVRQLCNEIQRLVARAADGTTIMPRHLARDLLRASAHNSPAPFDEPIDSGSSDDDDGSRRAPADASLAGAVEQLERRMIGDALRAHQGNVTRAARELRLTRRGLQLKLARYKIDANAS